jgi:4-amino-4-deoxy-L-arabinose transferase-like glycosyltransferase
VTAATTATPAETDGPAPRRTFLPGLPTWLIGLGLVLVHLAVTFQVRPAPRWNDGIFVLNDARDFPHVPLDHHALRIGNLLPVRAFLELFGYGQVAYYAWPFLTAILLVVAVFALGTVVFDRWTGAVATLLLIFHPVMVDTVIKAGTERMTTWQLLPDIPSTAFVTAGLALLIGAANRRGDGRPGDGAAYWWFLLAGFCFGWAYLVRELSVFFYPLLLGVLLAWRLPLRRWVQVALPMLGCLVLEMVLAQWAHGDPLARLKVDSEHGSAPLAPITRVDALLRFPRIVEVYPQTVVVLTTFVLMVLGALVVRRRAHVLFLAWFVVLWLPLTLVSGLLDPGFIRINASLMRYWVPVLPALVLGSAGFVSWLLARVRERLPADRRPVGVALTAAVAVLGVAVAVVPLLPMIARNPRDHAWNAMRAYLHQHDAAVDTIVTDDRDALVLGIYSREPEGGDLVVHASVEKTPHALKAPPAATGDPGTYLIWTPGLSRKKPQEFDGWHLLLKERELRLYGPAGG